LFYGWVIVALAFVAQFVVIGAFIQCFPVFLLPLSEEFGIGRGEASLPPVALMLCGIVISPLVGQAVGRFPIRGVMLVGALVMAIGFFGLSHATAYWQILVLYGLTGSFSLGALGVVSCNSLVVNWFERRRAMALGIAMIGMSISGAVLIPTATWALTLWGWRAVYQGFAWGALAMLPLIAGLVATRPSEMGLTPDGEAAFPEVDIAPTAPVLPATSARQLVTSPVLWLIAAACGLSYFGSAGIMNHGIAFAIDRGIDPMRGAVLLSAISIGAAFGKLLFGWLARPLGDRGSFGVAIACQLAGLLGLIAFERYSPLVAATGLYGLGIGGIAPLQAALLARGFGTRNFGPVMGLIFPMMIPFQITGAPLAGLIFDSRGGYDLALWIFLASTAASALALALLRFPNHDAQPAQPCPEPLPGSAARSTSPTPG